MDKRCKGCGEVKPLDAFYRHDGCRDGVRPECKACNLAEKAARHRQNPQPARDRTNQWRAENPERYRENQLRFIASGGKKTADRRSYLKRTYGITLEEYEAKLEQQGGVCKICGRAPRPDISLHVDHDHATGVIRSLLCFRCNVAIGLISENRDNLDAIAAYFNEHDPEVHELDDLIRARVAALPRPGRE